MNVRGWCVLAGMGFLILLAGCSRADPSLIGTLPDQPPAAGSAPPAGPVTVQVAADATGALVYQQQTLSGPADAEFSVSFQNPAAVEHNWVLAEPGQEQAIADAAGAAGGNPDGIEGVIAGNAPIAGSSEEISVPATPAGEYTYLCTVPGHFAAGMRGTIALGGPPPGGEPGASGPAAPSGEGGAAPSGEGGAAPGSEGGAPAVSSDPSGQLRYVEAELQAAAGQPFSVQFDNPSPLPHNWVLVAQGDEEAVAGAVQPDGNAEGVDGVLAGGPVIAAAQSAAIDVPALDAGAYSYICTVPGHYVAGMRGTLNVR